MAHSLGVGGSPGGVHELSASRGEVCVAAPRGQPRCPEVHQGELGERRRGLEEGGVGRWKVA